MSFAPGGSSGAALLDRDGTLIRHVPYLTDPRDVELLPGAAAGVTLLQSLGLKLAVCSNQSVIGRGMCSSRRVDEVNSRMLDLLKGEGAMLDAVFYCPHAPNDACGCRKPAIGMGRLASDQFGVAPSSMFVVGDQPSDVAFGIALGSVTVLIDAQGSSTVSADHVTGGLFEAALWIRDHLVAAGVGAEPASTSTKGP